MPKQQEVTIRLDEATSALFAEYQAYTRVSPEHYLQQLLEKTLPTLEAMVGALREAGEDEQAVMELFGKKMAESLLRQQAARS
ncbi:hypothetical protein CGX12_05725 [Zobellella denitrificans]|jgi:hypothetical protein|uniref:Uncharacterized protein n=1 Tax=Zobellella denitrificans TaxID=347534 RepID=A0A231N1D6_9GAMM|nr:hypothetical protein [Zobellella denitrificans]ATG72743.1 hypothetical protein AN401_01835 [Zobellella denitrificans]OXS16129.1 hypothetical protein CGX12_05725 [Zobellella denitrificans]